MEPYQVPGVEGDLYRNMLLYTGKYIKNEDGLFEKYVIDHFNLEFLYYTVDKETNEGVLKEPALTLDEIREKVKQSENSSK